jgi:hypothetical protein
VAAAAYVPERTTHTSKRHHFLGILFFKMRVVVVMMRLKRGFRKPSSVLDDLKRDSLCSSLKRVERIRLSRVDVESRGWEKKRHF